MAAARDHEPQSARAVLMIRPAAFGSNPLTSASNRFQGSLALSAGELQQLALREFEATATALDAAGVEVCVFEDNAEAVRPDAVFPNNWVSFHADGTAVLYPMMAENRRTERRLDVLERLSRQRGFRITRTIDLTHYETRGEFLEGTGSLVLDRAHRIAYACLSPRTNLEVLGDFAQQLDYEIVSFEAVDAGAAIYHTNVLLCVGERFAVLCAEVIPDEQRRAAVLSILEQTGHETILISAAQMHAFAGNALELESRAGGKVIALSQSAWESLDAPQRATLERQGRIVAGAIPTIERCGGGSVRCMIAEIHLPRRG
jgi:hypothetical protein